MFAEYFREKDGAETLVSDGGFLAYLIRENQFFITDFYIAKTHRKSTKHFLSLLRAAFKEAAAKDCEFLTCKVPLSHKNLNGVLLSYLKFGFRVTEASVNHIGLCLPLKECEWVEAVE